MITGSDVLNASMVNKNRWTFDFRHIPVSEAIAKLSTTSGVKIILHGDTGKMVLTRSFKDYTVENILIDIFSGENIAGVFQYQDQELTAINIWILPKTNGMMNPGMPPVFAHNNQSTTPPVLSQFQGYREIQAFIEESGIQPEVVVHGDQKDDKKASEPVRKNYYYFSGSGRINNSNSTTEDINSDSFSDTGEHTDSDREEVIVPPSPEPVKLIGLEPPPMPPGFIMVNQ